MKKRKKEKIKLEKEKIKVKEQKLRIEKKERESLKTKLKRNKKNIILVLATAFVASVLIFLLTRKITNSVIAFIPAIIFLILNIYFENTLKKSARIRKIESVFPDFLQLMSSNLRAGMTIDRAMLSSSRPEFSPLDEEILKAGKDMATGKSVETALLDMVKRIESDKIEKTILLIISGIRAGGNVAVLLEQTATNMRERDFVEKRAASSVMMYVIFILIAVAVGAPALFSLSTILVETLTNLLSGLPALESTQVAMPFALTSVNISITFIKYFSVVFILVLDVLASLVLGLITKGEEKQGLKFLLPIVVISISIFFIIRFFLANFVAGFIG